MGIFSKKQPYRVVEQSDELRSMLSFEPESEKDIYVTDGHIKSRWKDWLSTVLWGVSITGHIALISTIFALVYKPHLFEQHQTVDRGFTYRSFSVDQMVQRINGSLFPSLDPAWSRMEPSLEVEEHWSSFNFPRLIPLSKADVLKLGKDPSTAVQFPADYNMPEGSYIGSVDLYHKMHCLNELRKKAFLDYPYRKTEYANTNALEALDWIHLRHCADILAQDLQCNAKLDIITFQWMDTQIGYYPDFSIDRTCTNFDQFLEWNERNAYVVEDKGPADRPPGAKIVPAPDVYYQMYGFGGSVLYPDGKGFKPNGN